MIKKLMLACMFVSCSLLSSSGAEEPEQTNEEYCAEIYWEDEDNCEQPNLVIDREFCESLSFENMRKRCLKSLETHKEKEVAE